MISNSLFTALNSNCRMNSSLRKSGIDEWICSKKLSSLDVVVQSVRHEHTQEEETYSSRSWSKVKQGSTAQNWSSDGVGQDAAGKKPPSASSETGLRIEMTSRNAKSEPGKEACSPCETNGASASPDSAEDWEDGEAMFR